MKNKVVQSPVAPEIWYVVTEDRMYVSGPYFTKKEAEKNLFDETKEIYD